MKLAITAAVLAGTTWAIALVPTAHAAGSPTIYTTQPMSTGVSLQGQIRSDGSKQADAAVKRLKADLAKAGVASTAYMPLVNVAMNPDFAAADRDGDDSVGLQVDNGGGLYCLIRLNTHDDADTLAAVVTHEYGHCVDTFVAGMTDAFPQTAPLQAAVYGSDNAKQLIACSLVRTDFPALKDWCGYATDPTEFFARAFAQTVMQDSGDTKALKTLVVADSRDRSFDQWTAKADWAPIHEAMSSLIEKAN